VLDFNNQYYVSQARTFQDKPMREETCKVMGRKAHFNGGIYFKGKLGNLLCVIARGYRVLLRTGCRLGVFGG
jgi:hypothetical protein